MVITKPGNSDKKEDIEEFKKQYMGGEDDKLTGFYNSDQEFSSDDED
jgi:hypothetical protein